MNNQQLYRFNHNVVDCSFIWLGGYWEDGREFHYAGTITEVFAWTYCWDCALDRGASANHLGEFWGVPLSEVTG